MIESIVMPSYSTLGALSGVLVVLIFAARVAESVQKRSERKRLRVDLPLLRVALKSYERQIGKKQ